MVLDHHYLDNCGWLVTNQDADDVVLSSRVRLARNLAGVPFSNCANTTSLAQVRSRVLDALREVADNDPQLPALDFLMLDELDAVDRDFLAERNLISAEMADSSLPRALAVSQDETLSVMINEEDHLRMQCISPGRDVRRALELLDRLDDQLSERLDLAFSSRWGFLTACPTNVGSGMRCSVMAHLPALVLARHIDTALKPLQSQGMAIRGLGGEGSDISGNIFQISNQVTLGVSEADTVDLVARVTLNLREAETSATQELLEKARELLEDRVWRDYGILTHARSLTVEEARRLISSVRLGLNTELLKDVTTLSHVNEVLFCTGPANLQKIAGRPLEQEELNIERATFIRQRLSMN